MRVVDLGAGGGAMAVFGQMDQLAGILCTHEARIYSLLGYQKIERHDSIMIVEVHLEGFYSSGGGSGWRQKVAPRLKSRSRELHLTTLKTNTGWIAGIDAFTCES